MTSRPRYPAHPPLFLEEGFDRRVHRQAESRIAARLFAEEIEEVPLRHHRDERRRSVQVREVADRIVAAGDADPGAVERVVGPLQEPLQHSELREDLHRRGVDRVAAEIAKEVGMPFEHPDPHPGAREQQARHHPGGAAADDQQIGLAALHLFIRQT
jgi:hypothetical protein